MIHIARAGQKIGEFPREDIMALIRAKVIQESDDYWAQGMASWRKVSELKVEISEPAGAPDSTGPTDKAGEPASKASSKNSLKTLGLCIAGVLLLILIASKLSPAGVDPKEREAFLELQKKAQGGDAQSQVDLAFNYREGKGTGIDRDESLQWLLKAASLGNLEGLSLVAEYYGMDAPAGKKDLAKAYAYAKVALEIKGADNMTPRGTFPKASARLLLEVLPISNSQISEGDEIASRLRQEIRSKSNVSFRNSVSGGTQSTPAPAGTSPRYEFVGLSWEEKGEGRYHYYRVTGEVKNVGGKPGEPMVEMVVRSKAGNVVKSVQSAPTGIPSTIRPGESCGLDIRAYCDETGGTPELRFVHDEMLSR